MRSSYSLWKGLGVNSVSLVGTLTRAPVVRWEGEGLQRSKASLLAVLGPARIANRRAQGELAAMREEHRRKELRKAREAEMSQEDVARIENDLAKLAGAIPAEDGS
jgi:hypothetical protein